MTARQLALLASFATVAVALSAQTAMAAGNYKFCGKWSYQYNDLGGEDYLTYSGSSGSINAAGTWANVYRDGNLVYAGYMDSAGCTPTMTATAGTYVFKVTAAITADDARYFWIYPDSNKAWRWFQATYNLSGVSSGTLTYSPAAFGAGDETASVAATMVHASKLSNTLTGLPASVYTFFADDPCPNGTADACFNPPDGAVYIGNGMAFKKFVIAHEFGHKVQNILIGTLPFYTYGYNSSANICACNHLSSNENSHCLQSREHIDAAFMEGWGHFYASALFNNNSESNGWFTYYKAIWLSSTITLPAGWPISLLSPVKWMETNNCVSNGRGIEIDWMEFLYSLHTQGTNKYSFANFDALWEEACGGECVWTGQSSDAIWWAQIYDANNAVFGGSSAKATNFNNTADTYGVNW